MTLLRLGTRKSPLAQTQSREVAALLLRSNPDLHIETVLITTSGDVALPNDASPKPSNGKTLFTKEIEDALLEGRIDFAVHSMKDLPGDLPAGLIIGAVPTRADVRDVWISPQGNAFNALPVGARIGTNAVRRRAQLLHARPDLHIEPLRGNVDTRLRKASGYDGIVLAAAGVTRLGLLAQVTSYFSTEEILPAIGQGALAIEIRQDDTRTATIVQRLTDEVSEKATQAERSLLKHLGGSCQTPIAGLATVKGNELRLQGAIFSLDGAQFCQKDVRGRVSEAVELGKQLAEDLLRDSTSFFAK